MRALLTLVLAFAPVSASAQIVGAVDADRERVLAHLSEVEAELRAADVSHLSEAQIAARESALDLLGEYWRTGVFPHNEWVEGRNPVFIDDEGRACAVGHLLIETGHSDVAWGIADGQNLARVPAIEEPALLPWLEAHGLTVEEAARIQPSYCFCGFEEVPVCGTDGVTYENECTATECRGVAVAAEGECAPGDEIVRDCACTGPEDEDGGGCAVVASEPPEGLIPIALVVGAFVLRGRLRHRRRRPRT